MRTLSALRTGARLRTEACTGARHLCSCETTRATASGESTTGLAAEALSNTIGPNAKASTQPTSDLATKASGAASGKSSISTSTEASLHIAKVHTIILKTRYWSFGHNFFLTLRF